jgi:hypothetical protein
MLLGVPQRELARAQERQGCHTGQAERGERENNRK